MKTYAEKLKHPLWQKKRLEVMDRAGFKCESCSDTETTLHVHHRIYRKGREPWEYDIADLLCVCEACHGHDHQARDLLADALVKLTISGDIERVAGYAEGLALLFAAHVGASLFAIAATSMGRLAGVADALMIPWLEVFALANNQDSIDGQTLVDLSTKHHNARFPRSVKGSQVESAA